MAALDLLRNDEMTPPESIQNFLTLLKQKNLKELKDGWVLHDLETNEAQYDCKKYILPEKWTIKVIPKQNGRIKKIFVSPEGERLQSARCALEFMVKNNYAASDIELVARLLKDDGWITDELLPSGWYMKSERKRSGVFSYLTDTFQLLKSNISALDILQNNEKTTAEVRQNFATLLKRNSLKGNEDAWINESGDSEYILPENWRMKVVSKKDGRTQRMFMASDGERFQTVVKALKYLTKENYSQKDIDLFSNFLIKDGWERNDLLPKGWYRRMETGRKQVKTRYFLYLTEDFERIKSNTVALHHLKTNSNYTKEDIHNFIALLNPKSTNEYDMSKEDEDVPNGWQLQSIPTRKGKFIVISPNGQKFDAIRSALKYMYENNYSTEDIQVMSKHIFKEGWETNVLLPKGWYLRFENNSKESRLSYLSDDFQLLQSNMAAVDVLKNNGRSSNEDVDNLMTLIKQKSLKANEDKMDWCDENDPLPSGWKLRPIPTVKGKFVVISPDGTKFEAIRSALKFMVQNKFSSEDIEMMSKHLIKENWETHELMPIGWYIRKSSKAKYLTNNFELLKSNSTALDYLKSNGESTEKDIENFMQYIKQISVQGSTERYNWSEGNESIPEGWKIRSHPSDNRKSYVMSPTGMTFDSIRSALHHMAKNGSKLEDIQLMSKYLIKESWETHELLPKGWFIRSVSKGNEFLKDDFQFIKSNAAALILLKTNGTKEEIGNFMHCINNKSWEVRKEKLNWSDIDEHIPDGWKIGQSPSDTRKHFVISPNGIKFDSISSALKFMVENDYAEVDIKTMTNILNKEGWETHNLLPKGWYTKYQEEKRSDHYTYYLTDVFEHIRSNTVALDVLKNSDKATEENVQNFLSFIKLKAGQESERKHNWSTVNKNIPYGWKIRPNPKKMNLHYVLSPTGMKFDSVRAALQYMAKNNCKNEDIQIMARYLIKESWEQHELLPEGWYRRAQGKDKQRGFNYLTDDFELIRSNTTALHILKNNGKSNKKIIQNFIKLLKPKSSTESEGITNGSEDNEVVPAGWQLQASPTKQGKFIVVSPGGVKFEAIRSALSYMVANNYEKEVIDIMARHLVKENWKTHELLPKGWYMRSNSNSYLTDTYQHVQSNTEALDNLKNNGRASPEDIRNFMILVNQRSLQGSEERWEWSEANEEVPEGWKVRACPTNDKKHYVISPTGIKFESIRKSLHYMAQNNCAEKDIKIMSKQLQKEKWETHELLPKGWYRRGAKNNKKNGFIFLSGDFEILRSNTTALHVLKMDEKCTKEDIQNFMKMLNSKSTESYEDKINWSEENEAVPDGWQLQSNPTQKGRFIVISPDNHKFEAIRSALRFMAEKNFTSEDIRMMSKHLIKENWYPHKLLPKGWFHRTTSKGNHYLTDDFQVAKSNSVALEKLKSSSQEDIANFMLLINKKSPKEREERLNWAEDIENMPEGWRMRTSPTNKIKHFVSSPSGKQFECIRKALQYMAQNNYKKEDIQIMSRNLFKEKWETHDNLPMGWYRRSTTKGLEYLTDTFDFVKSSKAALQKLEREGKVSDIEKMMVFIKRKSVQGTLKEFNLSEETYKCLQNIKTESETKPTQLIKREKFDQYEDIPKGWQLETISASGDFRIISHKSEKFESFVSALKFMVENNYRKSDIDVMARNLTKEGWETNKLLPKGWYMKAENSKIHKFNYLTDKFEFLQSNVAAINELENDKNVTKAMVLNLLTLVKKISIKKSEDTEHWREANEILPEGWKMKTSPRNINKFFIISPDGIQFGTVQTSLRYMFENNYEPYNIEIMAKHLVKEGWETHSLLPKGWYMKAEMDKSVQYLTNEFQSIKSDTAALEFLTNDPYCTTEDMQTFYILVKQRSPRGAEEEGSIKRVDESLNMINSETEEVKNFKPQLKKEMNVSCDGYNWTESDGTFPVSWKKRVKNTSIGKQYEFFLLPDGNSIQGRVNALHHLVKNGYPGKDIQKMRGSLILDGWRQTNTLPEHWLQKKSAGLQVKIVSPSGQLFLSMKAVNEYLEKHKIMKRQRNIQSVKREAEENISFEQTRKKIAKDTNREKSLKNFLIEKALEEVADFEKIGKQSIKREADEKPDLDNLIKKMKFKRFNC